MKKLFVVCALFVAAAALAQEITPPKYQGADLQRFMARLVGESEKIINETECPAGELSLMVCIGCTIDTAGCITAWRYLDNTCEGRDHRDIAPATPRTKEIMEQALTRLGTWIPAEKEGRLVPYNITMRLRLPIEKIAIAQDKTPLLFLGKKPEETLHEWMKIRMHYDNRFAERGVDGSVAVKFYIEPDGAITIDEVLQSPSEKLSREVIRVIKNTKGKWTPKMRGGVPVREFYVYRCNFFIP